MSDDDWLDLFDRLYGAADRVERAIVERARRGTCDVTDRKALLDIFDTAVRQKRDLLVRLLDLQQGPEPGNLPDSQRYG